MGIISSIFSGGGEDNPNDCGYHDWDDGKNVGEQVKGRDIRLKKEYGGVAVEVRREYSCTHDGCEVSKEEFEEVYYSKDNNILEATLREVLERDAEALAEYEDTE